MNQGDIIEQGSHQELLAKGGFYYRLYNSQFAKKRIGRSKAFQRIKPPSGLIVMGREGLFMLEQIGDWIHRLVWGPATLGALLLIGVYFTLRSRFFPLRRMGLWWKETVGSFFVKSDRNSKPEARRKGISSFQAMTAALAGAMGTGNIVGVATALAIGGPGSDFLMGFFPCLG